MGKIVGGLVGGIGSLFTGKEKGRRFERAGRKSDAFLAGGQDYLLNESGLSGIRDTGAAAGDIEAGLLGIGGDPAKSSAALDNYLGSAGYNFQLDQGIDAINSNAAARGKLNSGATLKATQSFGQGLAGNFLDRFLDRTGGIAQRGQNAATTLASGVGNFATNRANNIYQAETGSAEARDAGYNNAFSGFGGAFRGAFGGGG